MVVLFQNALLISIRHLRLQAWRVHRENPWLFAGIAAAIGLHVGAMHFLPLQAVLGVAPVPVDLVLVCLTGALAMLAVSEAAKQVASRWMARR